MRRRDIKPGTLVDVKVEDPNFDWSGSTVKHIGNRFIRIEKGEAVWYISHLHIRPHVEGGAWAKKKEHKPKLEFKVGDRVDCDGAAFVSNAMCVGGEIVETDKTRSPYRVLGWWRGSGVVRQDEKIRLWVRPDQIKRHVPKEESKAGSIADDLGPLPKQTHVITWNQRVRNAIDELKAAKLSIDIEIGRLEGQIK